MQHEAGGPSRGGSSAGVKLQVDLGEAAGQDGGPHVVLAAQPHRAREEVVAGRLHRTVQSQHPAAVITFDMKGELPDIMTAESESDW